MNTQTFQLHAVVAMAANRIIGRNGTLPWHLPDDLKFFKSLTLGHAVIMGRRTWDSIGRPLPGRRNLVLSRTWQPSTLPPGVDLIRDPDELARLGLTGRVFVIGGAEIFRLLLPRCASVFVSKLHQACEGDTIMPPFEDDFPVATRLATFDAFDVWEHRRVDSAAPADAATPRRAA